MNVKLPIHCPACGTTPQVTQLTCPACQTSINGQFDLPALMRLGPDDQQFILRFVRSSGSLKAMAAELGVSYPTVRNRLDDLIQRLEETDHE